MSDQNKTIDLLSRETASNPQLQQLVRAELYTRDFKMFVKDAWKIIEPGTPYSHNWHIDYLVEELMSLYGEVLQDVFPEADWEEINSKKKNKVCINVPTRSMKTVLVSIMFPSWLVLHKPTLKVATVSYADDLATEINNKRRALISSDWYQDHFGDLVKIDKGSDRQDMIEFTSKGTMYSTSVGGVFTGKGADLIILDDPQKPGEMGTPSQRLKAIKFFRDTLPTRLNNRNTGIIIVIQQRLHYQDLTGYIQKNLADVYHYIKIPLDFYEDMEFTGKVTGTKWHIKAGDVLWPERMGRGEVDSLRKELGTANFEAQQQQNPTPDGGTIMNKEWFKRYDGQPLEFLKNFKKHDPEAYAHCKLICSWDMNYSVNVKRDSDYVGRVVLLHDPNNSRSYLLEAGQRRTVFKDTIKEVVSTYDKYDQLFEEGLGIPIVTVIEKKANGGPILELLESVVPNLVPFEPGVQDKVARMQAASVPTETGAIYVPEEATGVSWLEPFISQLVAFPYVDHDDMSDAFSQAVNYCHAGGGGKKKRKPTVALYF